MGNRHTKLSEKRSSDVSLWRKIIKRKLRNQNDNSEKPLIRRSLLSATSIFGPGGSVRYAAPEGM